MHRCRFGVEQICKVLQFAPSAYRRHSARQRDASHLSGRAQRYAQLMPHIERVWGANMQVYGADKVWMQMNCAGNRVARCTVDRLTSRMGFQGAVMGEKVRTTIPNVNAACRLDHAIRQFKAARPYKLWVSDFTYISTWQGWLCVAFGIDGYARRIVGWRVSKTMRTDFVLDALKQALYDRQPDHDALIHHSDRSS